jgi:uncharacterized ferritin-like protein (DUF455 family)
MELRSAALKVLCLSDPAAKVQAVQSLWKTHQDASALPTLGLPLDTQTAFSTEGLVVPGRPDRPLLCPPQQVPNRSVHTEAGLAAMVHAICHIEFNAINLALDAIWRYPLMPAAYYLDWFKVAHEESTHFALLAHLLQTMGHRYGDFEAHDGLWAMCEKTADDVLARMALVPRTLEARGLDATPLIQSKLHLSTSVHARALEPILDTILRDEVGHVAVGNHWFRWLCAQQGLDPLVHYPVLVYHHAAPRLKPPFNEEARLRAGFTADEIDWLMAQRLDS